MSEPKSASIFNDVLAPLTPGPSSSNTCGPYRIGKIASDLLGEKPERLEITMSTKGGFFSTFYGMGSDKAFIAGVLGKDLLSFDLESAYEEARAAGLETDFKFSDDIPSMPSEMAMITLSGPSFALHIRAVSLGGGDIIIDRVNGIETALDGRRDETVVLPSGKTLTAKCVYENPSPENPVVLFKSSKEMLDCAEKDGYSLWETAVKYEAAICGITEEDVWEKAESVYDYAVRTIDAGFSPEVKFTGVTSPKAAKVKKDFTGGSLIPLGAADFGSPYALSVMEYSNSHGCIVCMPTGGSSGVIPAAIKSAADSMGWNHDTCIKALLAAGLIGVFYYPTHYTGALGCQAEIGVAVSMAAGGLASVLSTDVKTAERAAVLGIQSLMGLICDPASGFVQTPCFIRNMTAVPTAFVCANAAVSGIDSLVSLDDMVQAVLNTGRSIKACGINDIGTCAFYKSK